MAQPISLPARRSHARKRVGMGHGRRDQQRAGALMLTGSVAGPQSGARRCHLRVADSSDARQAFGLFCPETAQATTQAVGLLRRTAAQSGHGHTGSWSALTLRYQYRESQAGAII
jgi:hypothetical protein